MSGNVTIDTEFVGDKAIDKNLLSPKDYFNYVKDIKHDFSEENMESVKENCLNLLKKATITGQTEMAKNLTLRYEVIVKELKAHSFGFDKFVYRSDIEKFIKDVDNKVVKMIELSKYKRDVDDSAIDKLIIAKENNLFDEYYVIFTDYSLKETKKVAKERREKDPILFGAFKLDDEHKVPEEHFFFIADWVDEYCDLTLEEMVKQYTTKNNEGMIYNVNIPQDPQELKEYMGLLDKKDPEKANPIKKIVEAVTTPKRGRRKKITKE